MADVTITVKLNPREFALVVESLTAEHKRLATVLATANTGPRERQAARGQSVELIDLLAKLQ